MAEWRVACDGETVAWQRLRWAGSDSGEQRLNGAEPAALTTALQQILAGNARSGDTLRLVLGSQHMRVAALPWPSGRLTAAEQRALLQQRWQERLDDINGWWLGVEGAGSVRLATAVRLDLLQSLGDTANRCAVRARTCLPASGLALSHAEAMPEARIAIREGPRETVIGIAGGQLANLTSGWRAAAGATLTGSMGLASAMTATSAIATQTSDAGCDIRFDSGPRSWLGWL